MVLETVRDLRETEQRAEDEKSKARELCRQKLAEAEKTGRQFLEQTRDSAKTEAQKLMQKAQEQAQEHINTVTAETAQTCQTLRNTADERMAQAVDAIVKRVVGG